MSCSSWTCRTISVQGAPLRLPRVGAVVDVVNRVACGFPFVVACQDWHPPGHSSFASSHPGGIPLDTVRIEGKEQVLWPDHCVQGTTGAAFHPRLNTDAFRYIIRKGVHQHLDSYSAFLENDLKTPTGLTGLLRELGVRRVFVAGLATDYCVHFSALDARTAGFRVKVLEDGCRGVDFPPGNLQRALRDMQQRGVEVIDSGRLGPRES